MKTTFNCDYCGQTVSDEHESGMHFDCPAQPENTAPCRDCGQSFKFSDLTPMWDWCDKTDTDNADQDHFLLCSSCLDNREDAR